MTLSEGQAKLLLFTMLGLIVIAVAGMIIVDRYAY